MAALKAFLVVAVLALGVAFVVARDEVFLLQSYQGRVVRTYHESIGNAAGHYDQEYHLVLDTGSGEKDVVVPMRFYRDLRPGATVKKSIFSKSLLIDP